MEAEGSAWSPAQTNGQLTRARALDSGLPMEMAVDTIGSLDDLPEHGTEVGGRLSQDAAPAVQVGVHVPLVGPVVSGVKVITNNAAVRNLEIGTDVVVQVVSDRQVDPLIRGNHGRPIARRLDSIEHVLRADTA
jgi:hypothetical protein